MDTYVINLDRSTKRFSEFVTMNAHLRGLHRFSAIDGNKLDLGALIQGGVLKQEIAATYTKGALGCAFSHIALWDKAIETKEAITICEDDAVFNFEYDAVADRIGEILPSDWDFILWGWNLNTFATFHMLPGISPCVFSGNQFITREQTQRFQSQPAFARPYRLYQAMGIVCYSVSPKGARALKDFCLPLRPMQVDYPALKRVLPNLGIDVMLSAVYPKLNAFLSFPPLVITRNDPNESIVQPSAGTNQSS